MSGAAGQKWAAPPDGNWTSGREGGVGSISNLCNNKGWSLGPDWSMSKVGTPPPHNSEKPHGLGESNTHTHNIPQYLSIHKYHTPRNVC